MSQEEKPDIILSDGTVVTHRRLDNSAWECYIPDREMTEAEWQEYCSILKARNTVFLKRLEKRGKYHRFPYLRK